MFLRTDLALCIIARSSSEIVTFAVANCLTKLLFNCSFMFLYEFLKCNNKVTK